MRTFSAAVLALAASSTLAAAQPSQPGPPKPSLPPPPAVPGYHIAGIHAFLYFHQDGSFDTKDLTAGGVALWNTIIGEGDAQHPSNTMLVKVDIGGPSFSNIDGKVTVVAKAGKRTLAKQVFELGDYFHEHGRVVTVPLIVTDVGCDEVKLTATLSGKGKRGSATAIVPFACGE
jgi:hypothetical protein